MSSDLHSFGLYRDKLKVPYLVHEYQGKPAGIAYSVVDPEYATLLCDLANELEWLRSRTRWQRLKWAWRCGRG